MRILVTGSTGMLGSRLVAVFERDHRIEAPLRGRLDITSSRDVHRALQRYRPDCVLNAAAFTGVDLAETETREAFRVNALGSRNLAAACYAAGALLVHFSTDYVFDGSSNRPYHEFDGARPINCYGASKLAGEQYIRQLNPAHLIIRTSWLFGPNGHHFVDRILSQASSKQKLTVVSDQQGSPTYTPDLAEQTLKLFEQRLRGTVHITNSGHCSRLEFAQEVIKAAGLTTQVEPIPSSALALKARRPGNSVLENRVLGWEGIPLLRDWREAVAHYLREGYPCHSS